MFSEIRYHQQFDVDVGEQEKCYIFNVQIT